MVFLGLDAIYKLPFGNKIIMKIAFFVEIFPSLSETFILNQITGLIDRGHIVDIYAFEQNKARKLHPDIHAYSLLKKTRFFDNIPRTYISFAQTAMGMMISNFPWLPIRVAGAVIKRLQLDLHAVRFRAIREFFLMPKYNRYDIIHCQFGVLALPVLDLLKIGAIHGKLVTSFRGYDATRVIDTHPGIYDDLFKKGNLFLPVSESLKNRLIEAGCDVDKICIHRSGIDCRKFVYTETRLDEGSPVRLISVARLVEKKGIAYANESIGELKRRGVRVQYTVVGDGNLRPHLENLVKTLDLRNEVKLIGWRDHEKVLQLLEKSHILLAPSVAANGDQEGIPNALKEAMAMGLPVVGTQHGGIPELIDDGVSGFLVPERNVEALVDRLTVLIEHPEDWRELGRRGSRNVHENYDIKMLNNKLVEHYQDILKQASIN
jgi:colanic acid/amylovoran biosynthesis glycosyltransferase